MSGQTSDLAGTIVSLEYLGRQGVPGGSRDQRPAAVFYLKYRSAADGGTNIAAKLFFPIGEPPASGWPESVWSHGFGDPAMDYRQWPLVAGNWRNTRGRLAGGWAHHGIVTLTPWMPGAGPSEPLGTYSPLSVERNAQANADGFLALRNLEPMFAQRPELLRVSDVTPRLDHSRQVFRTDCVSSSVLIHFAARWREYPATGGLKAFVADTFQPSVAYVTTYIGPFACGLEPEYAAVHWHIWMMACWGLAEDRGWPQETFFSPRAIEVLSEGIATPVGQLARVRAARVMPPKMNELAPVLLAEVSRDLGRRPTPLELRDWIFNAEAQHWLASPTIQQAVNDAYYQKNFAASDPFFPQNITPFEPGVPLLVIGRGGDQVLENMPDMAERFRHMTLPRVEELRSWGWDARVFQDDRDAGMSFTGGLAQRWALQELARIL
jgi:hypothetical protein